MIYVDRTQEYPDEAIAIGARWAGNRWCHCWSSDNNESELLKFGSRIGMKPGWVQRKRPEFIHFDLTPKMRRKAMMEGAVEMNLGEWLNTHTTSPGRLELRAFGGDTTHSPAA